MTRKTIAQRADDSVRWTGIPRLIDLSRDGRQRHHLRVLPIVTLALASSGMGMIVFDRDRYWLGYGLLMAGFALGNFLPIFGPVKPWGESRVDEWDRRVRHNAYFAAFATIGVIATLGLFFLPPIALLHGWDSAAMVREMSAFAFYLLVLWSSVPTLHASWATRPITPDDMADDMAD